MENERLQFEKFPLGFWAVYPYAMSGFNEKEIAELADCGMTLTMSPDTSHDNVEDTVRALDLCVKYGIKLILCDKRTSWTNIRRGEEEFRAIVRQAYDDYGKHPAVFGFFVGDEPSEWQMDEYIRAHRIVLEECPGLVPFVNHYAGNAKNCYDFMRDSGCRLLSFDRYSQMNPETEGVDDFFNDFIEYKELAEKSNTPLLSIILSVGHYRYRVPDLDDIRWQLGAAVACGSNAIFWFTYHNPTTNNYRGAPISEFGEKNPTWYALKDVQRRFNRDYADLVNNLTYRGAYWFERGYGRMNPFTAFAYNDEENLGIPVVAVDTPHHVPGIISFFEGRGKYAGKKYVMVTNNSWKDSDPFHIVFKPTVKKIYRCYSDREVDFDKDHSDAMYERWDTAVHVCTYQAPGQFEIFRVEE